MEEFDGTYRPQSPDLSGPVAEFEHPQHREYRGSVSHISPFTPTESKTPFTFPPPAQSAHSNYVPQASPYSQHAQQYQQPPASPVGQHYNPYFGNVSYNAPTPQHTQQYAPQYSTSQYASPQGMVKKEDPDADFRPEEHEVPMAGPGRLKRAKEEEPEDDGNDAPGVREGITVNTKFPVARIKRIMQADEDVGKVAQVTPVVVSKALELFMISLVTKAAAQARERGSKRVMATHLKQAVMEDNQFDYLQEIVAKVVEAPPKGDKGDDSDDAMEGAGAGGGKKKRAAGGGRKKRKNSDDDS